MMAQDDSKGQPASTRGKSPAPSAPGSPDTRGMNAPPPPEAPETESEPEPADGGTEPDAIDAGDAPDDGGSSGDADGGSSGDADGGSASGTSESELLSRIEEAEKDLEAMKADLARAEERRKADEAATAMVNDYKAELPALEALEAGLRQYQTAETRYLETVLPASAVAAIKEVDKVPRKNIDDLRVKVENGERDAAEARRDLTEARAEADAAKQRSEALKRPAASIRDRLKGADAVRAEAKKASDSGHYALAYWLVREGGKLDQAMAGPAKTRPEDLAAEIRKAAAEQATAEEAVEALENRVKELDASLQEDRTKLATSQRTVDVTILTELAKLNPPSVEAA
jgi:hypothetical protein